MSQQILVNQNPPSPGDATVTCASPSICPTTCNKVVGDESGSSFAQGAGQVVAPELFNSSGQTVPGASQPLAPFDQIVNVGSGCPQRIVNPA